MSIRIPDPCVMTIFGASGDLTHRKLIPSLFNLFCDGQLPASFAVMGFARKPKTDDMFREECHKSVAEFSRLKPIDEAKWAAFAPLLHYTQADYGTPEDYDKLAAALADLDAQHGTAGNRLYYIATPPEVYPTIIERLGSCPLCRTSALNGWTRVIVEKPFGTDLQSAKDLNTHVHTFFNEDEIYRIDHYLGKETVQNIFVFRFSNGIFEPIWNRLYVDHVQITVAENIGVEGRGSYYETAGVVRDIVQNHMLQLLALVAMEPTIEFSADAVHNEKVKVLKALRVDTSRGDGTVRGQYGPGKVNGQIAPGYTQEEGVAPDSNTETYLAMKMRLDNWRWAGVPFYVRSGKRLSKRVTEIAIQFKMPPLLLFSEQTKKTIQPNMLVMTIQPDEGISIMFGSKAPGTGDKIQPVVMDFKYGEAFNVPSPDAYERLLLDCILGDSTLFTRADEVERAWQIITPVLESWKAGTGSFIEQYRAGTRGPKEADDFIRADGREWRPL